MATQSPRTPRPAETTAQKVVRGNQALRDLPIARSGGLILGVRELDALIIAMQNYLDSPKKNTPPSKDLLRAGALSLMQEGTHLSTRWDKSQLSLVVQKWALSALQLRPLHTQANLFVQASIGEENRKKVLLHKCCLKDEFSDEIVELSIASPSPVKQGVPARGRKNPEEGEDGNARENFDLTEEFDDEFLREIDELANQADLAAIPVHFYTPGVNIVPGRDSNADDSQEGLLAQRGSGPASGTRACINNQFVNLLSAAIKEHFSTPQTGGNSRPARQNDDSNPRGESCPPAPLCAYLALYNSPYEPDSETKFCPPHRHSQPLYLSGEGASKNASATSSEGPSPASSSSAISPKTPSVARAKTQKRKIRGPKKGQYVPSRHKSYPLESTQ